jgi:hypothetical protein
MPPKIKKSFFPESEEQMLQYGIQNTMRVLPHDMNSGGFFVALLKKHKGFTWKYEVSSKGSSRKGSEDSQK